MDQSTAEGTLRVWAQKGSAEKCTGLELKAAQPLQWPTGSELCFRDSECQEELLKAKGTRRGWLEGRVVWCRTVWESRGDNQAEKAGPGGVQVAVACGSESAPALSHSHHPCLSPLLSHEI